MRLVTSNHQVRSEKDEVRHKNKPKLLGDLRIANRLGLSIHDDSSGKIKEQSCSGMAQPGVPGAPTIH